MFDGTIYIVNLFWIYVLVDFDLGRTGGRASLCLRVKGKSGWNTAIAFKKPFSFDGTRTGCLYWGGHLRLVYPWRATTWTCLTSDPSKVAVGLHSYVFIRITNTLPFDSQPCTLYIFHIYSHVTCFHTHTHARARARARHKKFTLCLFWYDLSSIICFCFCPCTCFCIFCVFWCRDGGLGAAGFHFPMWQISISWFVGCLSFSVS